VADKVKQAILNKARTDKFILVLSTPPALRGTSSKTERRAKEKSYQKVLPDSVQFSIYGAIVPGISVPSEELHYAGQSLKISTHNRPAYDDLEVNFTVDNQFNNYWYLWRWLDVLNDSKYGEFDYYDSSAAKSPSQDFPRSAASNHPKTTSQHNEYLLDYQVDMTIYGLNEFNKNVIEFTYTKAFPVSLGSIGYSYRDPSEMESSVTFSFSQLLVNLL
jgi:hypothetical protein